MSRTRQYHKRQAKAIQRRRHPAAERLQRDHVQAQRAIKALEQALHDIGLPDNLVKEIEGRLQTSAATCWAKSLALMFPVALWLPHAL